MNQELKDLCMEILQHPNAKPRLRSLAVDILSGVVVDEAVRSSFSGFSTIEDGSAYLASYAKLTFQGMPDSQLVSDKHNLRRIMNTTATAAT